MTRRGSIAYYMSAVVFGSFFLATSFYLYDLYLPQTLPEVIPGAFLRSYFSLMLLDFFPLLLGAFVLRRVAFHFCWTRLSGWLAGGSAIFLAVFWMISKLGTALVPGSDFGGWPWVPFFLIWYGPYRLLEKPLWLTPIPGFATAYMLFVVYRAFELKPSERGAAGSQS